MQNRLLDGRFEYFTQKELEHGQTIPDHLYHNIIPTASVLDYLRREIKEPIYINSTYRSPVYNKTVGGAKNSLHLFFNAIDFTINRSSGIKKMIDMRKIYKLLNEFDKYGFSEATNISLSKNNFGLGLYLRGKNSFIHLDTRGLIGMRAPARWLG